MQFVRSIRDAATDTGTSDQCSLASPSGQRRSWKIDAVAGEDLRLPIKRRVIAILANQHLGQQRRRRQAAGDHPLLNWRLYHSLTAPAGILWDA
ncbi:hypothetical protein UP10_40655 [Bradyrhizobium sp. LTSPM299]|nr:hypothetical protein UP10_40655 [Bradyrhizobium sp. LTSPM299]